MTNPRFQRRKRRRARGSLPMAKALMNGSSTQFHTTHVIVAPALAGKRSTSLTASSAEPTGGGSRARVGRPNLSRARAQLLKRP